MTKNYPCYHFLRGIFQIPKRNFHLASFFILTSCEAENTISDYSFSSIPAPSQKTLYNAASVYTENLSSYHLNNDKVIHKYSREKKNSLADKSFLAQKYERNFKEGTVGYQESTKRGLKKNFKRKYNTIEFEA